jgi:hypothetical protein
VLGVDLQDVLELQPCLDEVALREQLLAALVVGVRPIGGAATPGKQ